MVELRLYGTRTSPYVRRVRVLAHELGISYVLVDAHTDEGQAELRAVNPIWKVPAVSIVDSSRGQTTGRQIFDSTVIASYLLAHHGPGPFAPFDPDDLERRNRLTVIDGSLDALINIFYLNKDGVAPDQASYLAKQRARAESGFQWLEARVTNDSLSGCEKPHFIDVALATSIGWILSRNTYPIAEHAGLLGCYQALAQRESFAATRLPD